MESLSPHQSRFFDAFGYLVLPGLLQDEIGWITKEFEEVFRQRGVEHDGTQRSCIVPFIDQRARLCTLLDHPSMHAVVLGLLGEDYNYLGGDGNFYTGDTQWHSDGFHHVGRYLKVALYLDPVARDTGCLRVIPGSHRLECADSWEARQARNADELWGVAQRDVPCVPLESQPGDVVAFNHNLMHGSFGGSRRRRMFTLNFCSHCETEDEIAELRKFINAQARFWIDHLHSEVIRDTASPQRMRYLQQVMDHEDELPALAARARAEAKEPSRG